jgi:hypothetical protein
MKDLSDYLEYLSDDEVADLEIDTYAEPCAWMIIPDHLRDTVEKAVGLEYCSPNETYYYYIEYHPDDDSIHFGIDTDLNIETLSVSKQTEDRFKAKFKKELGESVFSTSTIKASSNIKYPVVTLSSEGENITGRLDSGEFIQAIVKAMHQNDEFAMAMANFFDPEINNEIWEDTTYEEVAIGIIDFCKDQYREWKSLQSRGREDNPFIIISEDESIVIS